MQIKPKQYAQSLYESIDGAGDKEAKVIIDNFAQTMIRNNHGSKLEKVLRHFSTIWNKNRNIIEAKIISANVLSAKTEAEIKKYIDSKTKGSEVRVERIIDKNIIGGFVLRLDDIVFDLSLKTKVNEIKKIIS